MGERSNTSRGTASRILLGFALLATLVAVVSIDDRLHRDSLEEFGLPTGLGDDELFDLAGAEFDPVAPILKREGKDVFRRRSNPTNRADDEMLKVARDDGGRLYFYREERHLLEGAEAGEETGAVGIYFVKVGDDLYLEVGESTAEIPLESGTEGDGQEEEP